MGHSNSKAVFFTLTQEGKKDPYIRMGPFTFESLAQLYKEEQIDENTMVWTNEKFRDAHGKKVRMEAWTKIRDMPPEFLGYLKTVASQVPDRRYQPDAPPVSTVSNPEAHEAPPVPPS